MNYDALREAMNQGTVSGLPAQQKALYALALISALPERALSTPERAAFSTTLASIFGIYMHLGLAIPEIDLPPPDRQKLQTSAQRFLERAAWLCTPPGISVMADLMTANHPAVEFLISLPNLYQVTCAVDQSSMNYRGLVVRGHPLTLYDTVLALETSRSIAGGIEQADLNFLLDARYEYVVDKNAVIQFVDASERSRLALHNGLTSLTDENDEAEGIALARQFARALILEAAQAGRVPLMGAFRLVPPDDIRTKANIDHIRLVIKPHGMWFAMWFNAAPPVFKLMFWSPRWEDAFPLLGEDLGVEVIMTHLIMAGIWRDATVVRNAALRQGEPLPHKSRDRRPKGAPVIVLPRTVHETRWATDADILHALVTCALELDRFALLSSSREQSQPMNRAADLIVKAIKAIDALATRPGAVGEE